MLYFKRNADGKIEGISDDHQHGDGWETARHTCKTMAEAEALTAEVNAQFGERGDIFLACDKGSHTWPRYDVIRAPKVGTPVSYSFNGDSYPDGHITKVGGTNCSRVYTDTGSVYNRRRQSASWIKRGGTWSLIQGHVDERNPSF